MLIVRLYLVSVKKLIATVHTNKICNIGLRKIIVLDSDIQLFIYSFLSRFLPFRLKPRIMRRFLSANLIYDFLQ